MAKIVELAPVVEVVIPPKIANTLLAGWNFFYWLFGARVSRWEVKPDGIYAYGFSIDNELGIDLQLFLSDIENQKHTHRLELIPLFDWLNGKEPEKITDSKKMSIFLVQYIPGVGGKSPLYAKNAIKVYKKKHDLEVKRGPKATPISLIEDFPSSLEGLEDDELHRMRSILEETISSRMV